MLRCALVEASANRFNDALRILNEASPLFENSENHALAGKFHDARAFVLKNLGSLEQRDDYTERALSEYAAAGRQFERAGHTRRHACVESNLGFMLSGVGRYAEAHERLDRAQALFTTLKDNVSLAQLDETRARVLCAEGKVAEAERVVRSAVRRLEEGGEQTLLASALTTHGVTLGRLGKYERARLALRSALEIARHAGDAEGAGLAGLAAIEELDDYLSNEELSATFEVAAELLAGSRSVETHKRLASCARRVLFLAHLRPAPPDWTNFSFKEALRRFEAGLIERALRDARGSVTSAARMLGFKHHHSLASIINNRHRHLLPERKPVVHRRPGIMVDSSDCCAGASEAGAEVYLNGSGELDEADETGALLLGLDADE
ncbi:MAG TPA: tetratricopeptide repeat protein [Pyrinomonadaceae bacterium]|nr:tetratricopeptide repeat protein [Pyrinomonadaceae bacterium]